MARRGSTNWDAIRLKEKGGPRPKQFREWSRDRKSPGQIVFAQSKADLKAMLEQAAANTAEMQKGNKP